MNNLPGTDLKSLLVLFLLGRPLFNLIQNPLGSVVSSERDEV